MKAERVAFDRRFSFLFETESSSKRWSGTSK